MTSVIDSFSLISPPEHLCLSSHSSRFSLASGGNESGSGSSDSDSKSSHSGGSAGSGSSESTIEDANLYSTMGMGKPLERMEKVETAEDQLRALRPIFQGNGWRDSFSSDSSEDSTSTSSSIVYDMCVSVWPYVSLASYVSVIDSDFEALIDDMLADNPNICDSPDFVSTSLLPI
jgi:hypothetical protein